VYTTFGGGEFQGLQGLRKRLFRRLANEDADMLRHDYVAEDFEVIAAAGEFE